MTAPTPAPNHEVSVLREHLERYRSVTLQTLDLVPDAKLGWRALDALRTFAEQFVHIAQTEDFYMRGLLANDWNFGRLEPVAERITRKLIRERLNDTRAFALEKLDTVPAAHLDTVVVVPNVPVQWPLRSWLWYVVEHEMHHTRRSSRFTCGASVWGLRFLPMRCRRECVPTSQRNVETWPRRANSRSDNRFRFLDALLDTPARRR